MGVGGNLAFALFYDCQFAEARKAAETLRPSPSALMVAAEAALHGSQAAIADARRRKGSLSGERGLARKRASSDPSGQKRDSRKLVGRSSYQAGSSGA